MINYDPFWTTLQKRNITKYQLIYHWGLSSNTLRRMSHNEPISTTTLNELCLILDCMVSDILQFVASDDEITDISIRKEEINNRRKRRKTACTKP
ncbi:MAG: helix-turn-helix domain-containing protein [Lachnospiraceae bacterium]|nr:helix-turn-helix domain-containing protein [Lachnospiraceae bacterium]